MADLIGKLGIRWRLEEISELIIQRATGIRTGRKGGNIKENHKRYNHKKSDRNASFHGVVPPLLSFFVCFDAINI
jgi:hypothetical protein